jgi:hypothetical protein
MLERIPNLATGGAMAAKTPRKLSGRRRTVVSGREDPSKLHRTVAGLRLDLSKRRRTVAGPCRGLSKLRRTVVKLRGKPVKTPQNVVKVCWVAAKTV